jgi:hypothetical protein
MDCKYITGEVNRIEMAVDFVIFHEVIKLSEKKNLTSC